MRGFQIFLGTNHRKLKKLIHDVIYVIIYFGQNGGPPAGVSKRLVNLNKFLQKQNENKTKKTNLL
jgi:hypothetical protein